MHVNSSEPEHDDRIIFEHVACNSTFGRSDCANAGHVATRVFLRPNDVDVEIDTLGFEPFRNMLKSSPNSRRCAHRI